MDSSKVPKRKSTLVAERYRRKTSLGTKVLVVVSIGGVALLLFFVMRLVSRTGSSGRLDAPPELAAPARPARPPRLEPDVAEVPAPAPADVVELPKKEEPQHKRPTGPLYGQALRDAINKAYLAAKRRSELYAGQNHWGKAIGTMEEVCDQFDDEELRLRVDPDIQKLRERATVAFNERKAEAERLAKEARYDDARKAFADIAATFERPEFVEPAKQRIQELTEREEAEDAARYKALMTPLEAMIPEWKLDEALDQMSKLHFPKAKYKEMQAARVAQVRALVALRDKMIEKVNLSRPRLLKLTLRVPGLAGDLAEADAEGVVTETERGREKIPWTKFGPEATLRLALLTGDPQDGKHHVAVARLLMEVGYFRRAKAELERAKELKANVAADEAELARRQGEGAAKD